MSAYEGEPEVQEEEAEVSEEEGEKYDGGPIPRVEPEEEEN